MSSKEFKILVLAQNLNRYMTLDGQMKMSITFPDLNLLFHKLKGKKITFLPELKVPAHMKVLK